MNPLLSVLDKGWPFAASILAGVFAAGELHMEVADVRAQQTTMLTDHDTITRMGQEQKDMAKTLDDIARTLHRIEQGK